MKKHLTNEDISAYLDGEHDRAEAVRKHLQQCAECAREHVALQKLSTHVKALPECDVTFGFTERVMRAVETPQPHKLRLRRFWVPAGAGLAAALALIVGLATLSNEAPMDRTPAHVATQPQITPDGVRVDLEGLLGPNGSERYPFAEAQTGGADLQVAYASEVVRRPVPHEFFTGTDYNASLIALNSSEKETLLQLLGSTLIDEQMM